ncbi:MAG: response regulator [Candidatus Omnitrophota bacterium]
MFGDLEKNKDNKPMNILLAEDNEADAKITLRAFDRAKLKSNIFVVTDGEQALDFVYHRGKYQDKEKYPKPDLILLDIKMPKVDGFGVLREIKSDLQYNYIPIIILTSSKEEEDVVRSYKYGAASFIPKSMDYDDFVKVVEGFNYYWQILNKLPNPDITRE